MADSLEASVVMMTNAVSSELTTAAAATPIPTGSQRRSGGFRCLPPRAGGYDGCGVETEQVTKLAPPEMVM
ncbi:hypothetical protein H7H51_29175 [Mycolicibacterium farcinogenes]|nr:hypothetical protein [Mycolicibacterium farcinogenes]